MEVLVSYRPKSGKTIRKLTPTLERFFPPVPRLRVPLVPLNHLLWQSNATDKNLFCLCDDSCFSHLKSSLILNRGEAGLTVPQVDGDD